jgi:hypothetical protein
MHGACFNARWRKTPVFHMIDLPEGVPPPDPLPPPPFTKAAATETPCYRDQPLCRPCSAAQEQRRFPRQRRGPSVFLLARLPRGRPFVFTRQHGSEAAAPRWNRPKKSQAAPSFLNLHPLNLPQPFRFVLASTTSAAWQCLMESPAGSAKHPETGPVGPVSENPGCGVLWIEAREK